VNEAGGTGAAARCPEVEIAGKTGTAQVVSEELQASAKNAGFNNNAWFVGYAPPDKPEIVVAALVLRGGHSTVAVPIAREVIRTYFEKRRGPKTPPSQMETQVRVLSETRPTAPPAAPHSGFEQVSASTLQPLNLSPLRPVEELKSRSVEKKERATN
jgi:penicillin-binding protein 2